MDHLLSPDMDLLTPQNPDKSPKSPSKKLMKKSKTLMSPGSAGKSKSSKLNISKQNSDRKNSPTKDSIFNIGNLSSGRSPSKHSNQEGDIDKYFTTIPIVEEKRTRLRPNTQISYNMLIDSCCDNVKLQEKFRPVSKPKQKVTVIDPITNEKYLLTISNESDLLKCSILQSDDLDEPHLHYKEQNVGHIAFNGSYDGDSDTSPIKDGLKFGKGLNASKQTELRLEKIKEVL